MNTPEDPVKKIVSKGKYAQVQGLRAGTVLLGLVLLVAGVACAAITFCFCAALILALTRSIDIGSSATVVSLVCAVFFAAGTYGLGRMGVMKLDQAEKMNNVVPLTRTTAPYLRAPESLVRASEEPIQASKAILLRAISEKQEQHEEQLLKASVKRQE